MEKTKELGDIQNELRACGYEKMSVMLSNVLERQREKNIRTLGIIGDDLVGKSTVINALLEDIILPTTVIPTTAEITIKYGQNTIIYGSDGTEFETDKLSQLTEEQDYLTIEVNSAFLKENSLEFKEFHGLLNKSKLSDSGLMSDVYKCDAVILVMTAEHLLSESECSFIENYIKYVGASHILLVVNKLSAVSESDVFHVLDYAKNQIENKFSAVKWTVLDSSGHYDSIIKKYVSEDIKQASGELFTMNLTSDDEAIKNTLICIKEQLKKQKADLEDLEEKSIEEIEKKKKQNKKQKELEKTSIDTALIEFQQKRNNAIEEIDKYIKESFDEILSKMVKEFSNAQNKYSWYENDLEKTWRSFVISASSKVDEYASIKIDNDIKWLNDLLNTKLGGSLFEVSISNKGLNSESNMIPYGTYKKYALIGIGGGVVIGYCLFRIVGATIGFGGGLLAYSYLEIKDSAQINEMQRQLTSKIRDISSDTRKISKREIEKIYTEVLAEFQKEATEIIDAKYVIDSSLDNSLEEHKCRINDLIKKIEEI